MKPDFIYLGNALVLGKNQKREFNKIKDCVQSRLEGWQSKLLSKVGKATLINSVVQAIPAYTVSTFSLPRGLCNELDAMVRRFWWGAKQGSNRFLSLKAWRDLYCTKDSGGLGFKSFSDINLALQTKLGWMIAKGEDMLWTEVFRKKYLQRKSFFTCTKKRRDSLIWKGILSTRELIQKGACFKIGNGWSINISRDPWIPSLERKWLQVQEGWSLPNITKVIELINQHSLSWNEELVKTLFNQEEANLILELELPQISSEDSLCWTASRDGKFSVKSCFGIIQRMDSGMDFDQFWGFIWRSGLHENLKLFLWRLASNVLPTKAVLNRRLMGGDILCVLCGQKEEEALHLFKYCSVARAIGFASLWGICLDALEGETIRDMIISLCSNNIRTGNIPKLLIMTCLWYTV